MSAAKKQNKQRQAEPKNWGAVNNKSVLTSSRKTQDPYKDNRIEHPKCKKLVNQTRQTTPRGQNTDRKHEFHKLKMRQLQITQIKLK